MIVLIAAVLKLTAWSPFGFIDSVVSEHENQKNHAGCPANFWKHKLKYESAQDYKVSPRVSE